MEPVEGWEGGNMREKELVCVHAFTIHCTCICIDEIILASPPNPTYM